MVLPQRERSGPESGRCNRVEFAQALSVIYTELASLCYHTVFTLACTHCLTLVCARGTKHRDAEERSERYNDNDEASY
jgi:hypothetical protein